MSAIKKLVNKVRNKDGKQTGADVPSEVPAPIPHANPHVHGDPKGDGTGMVHEKIDGVATPPNEMANGHAPITNGDAVFNTQTSVDSAATGIANATGGVVESNPAPGLSTSQEATDDRAAAGKREIEERKTRLNEKKEILRGTGTPGTSTPTNGSVGRSGSVVRSGSTARRSVDIGHRSRASLDFTKRTESPRRARDRSESRNRTGSRVRTFSPSGTGASATGASTPTKRKPLLGFLPSRSSSSGSSDGRLNIDGEPMSKNQRRKDIRREEKEISQLENEERQREIDARRKLEEEAARRSEPKELRARYGNLPVNQSQTWNHEARAKIGELRESTIGQTITLRARIHTSRAMSSKLVFLVLRQQECTLQAVLNSHEAHVSEYMVKWVERIPIESVVLVKGRLVTPVQTVKGATVHHAELQIDSIHVISEVTDHLPFDVYEAELSKEDEVRGDGEHRTSQLGDRTRLANRILDLRTKTAQSIFRIQSGVGNVFRSYLDSQGFIEIHTPKLQGGATESGASVFKVEYFGRKAFLAQSPQLAKQMAIASDFERVYEIGPVFRAENSNTHRHLTEYVGLDLEMAFEEHYHEVLDVIDNMFKHVFETLYTRFEKEMKIVQDAFPHKKLVWLEKTPRLPFKEGIRILRESGYKDEGDKVPSEDEDLSTRAEIRLGQLVKEQLGTDFYILDKFPESARPFYTMPDANDPKTTNSFDIFIRGQEVLSGGQRIHDATMLEERMANMGVHPETMEEYMEGFRWGAPTHAGGGIGLERVVMLLLNLGNIRHASMFPRDPKSLPPQAEIVKLRHPEATTLAPPIIRRSPNHPIETFALQPIEKLIANYGDATNTSWLDDRYQVWRDTTGAAIGYVIQDNYCMIFGNPLCDKSQISKVVSNFLKHLKQNTKYKPVWMLVSAEVETCLAEKFGWSSLSCVAEERLDPSHSPEEADKDVARKIRHAAKEGVVVHDVEKPVPQEIMDACDKRIKDWLANRKGQQVHLTQLNPWRDMEHRLYFVAKDATDTVVALVVLAQLSPEHGYQVKYSLEFPNAPSGSIEMIISHALKAAAAEGATTVTFGSGAVDTLTPKHNLSGLRTKMLSHSYHAIVTTLKLTRKTEFREKLGAEMDPVYVCFPKNGMGPNAIKAVMRVFGDGED